MKLIREEIETVDFIVEEKNGKKSMYIEGIFLQGDLTLLVRQRFFLPLWVRLQNHLSVKV